MHTMTTISTISGHSRPPLTALGNFLWKVMAPEVSCSAALSASVQPPCVEVTNKFAMNCILIEVALPCNRICDDYLYTISTMSYGTQPWRSPTIWHRVAASNLRSCSHLAILSQTAMCWNVCLKDTHVCGDESDALPFLRALILAPHEGTRCSYTDDTCLVGHMNISMPRTRGLRTLQALHDGAVGLADESLRYALLNL